MLPQVVEQTMSRLCASLNKFTSNIEAVYIYGSVALRDYIQGSSDIDFIAVLRYPPSELDIQAISAAHKEVEAEFPNTDIMGSYILGKDLGKSASEISSLLVYYNKQLNDNESGADINPITWWILKNHGIKFYGSKVSLNYQIESLASYVIENLNTYWVGWIERLEKQLELINLSDQELDEAVEWCTLGMLRQLYTVKERDIKSKIKAGFYGITIIPQQWHEIIYEAINIKRLQPDRYYTSKEKRLADLVGLLRYIHLEANRIFDNSTDLLN